MTKKSLKFSFDVSTLPNYTDQEKLDLVLRSFAENKTFTTAKALGADLEIGIKSSRVIQKFALTAVPQTNTGCGFNASGSQAFTQITLTPGTIKYQDKMCPKQLESKWTQHLLSVGQNYDEASLSFMDTIEMYLKELIAEYNEVMDWQGDTTSWSAYLNKYDGIIKFIDTLNVSIAGNTGSISSITNSNAFSSAIAMVDALPARLKGKSDLVMYVGTDDYDKIVTNLLNLNLYHHSIETGNYEMILPAKGIKVIGVVGLDGTNRRFLLRASNLSWGTDAEGDSEDFRIWYSQDDDDVKYSVKFTRGVVLAYPDEVVQFKLA